jgi:hypothetical protein
MNDNLENVTTEAAQIDDRDQDDAAFELNETIACGHEAYTGGRECTEEPRNDMIQDVDNAPYYV